MQGQGRRAQPPERCSTTDLEWAEAESALNPEPSMTNSRSCKESRCSQAYRTGYEQNPAQRMQRT